MTATKVKVSAVINVSLEKVWEAWNSPSDIMKWNYADPSWHCPSSENDLKAGGKFTHRMEAKDGSFGFDFEGQYDQVLKNKEISYTMADGRKVRTLFESQHDGNTWVETTFDAEQTNDPESQQEGWQAILDNFKAYVESDAS